MPNFKTCTHIKVSGVRCGSPALRGEQFCYFHQNAHRGVRRPKHSRLHPIALIEDEASIQYALMEVMNALMRNTIDLKRATLILRALHIAVKNASRVKFEILGRNTVREIPEFADPPLTADIGENTETELPYSAFLPPQTEKELAQQRRRADQAQEARDRQSAIRANLERAAQNLRESGNPAPHVGADALVRPAREASASTAEARTAAAITTSPTPAVPPHNFKKAPAATTRKPPTNAMPATHDRKSAATRASGG